MNILVINPGSTSTKFAVYQDEQPLFCHVLEHSVEELSQFPNIDDQMPLRSELILHNLEHNNLNLRFDAIISRGGMVHPIESGVYAINDKMLHDIRHTTRKHACNLGCTIARQLAERFHVEQVLTADPCIVDELCEEARITGMPELPHTSIWRSGWSVPTNGVWRPPRAAPSRPERVEKTGPAGVRRSPKPLVGREISCNFAAQKPHAALAGVHGRRCEAPFLGSYRTREAPAGIKISIQKRQILCT